MQLGGISMGHIGGWRRGMEAEEGPQKQKLVVIRWLTVEVTATICTIDPLRLPGQSFFLLFD